MAHAHHEGHRRRAFTRSNGQRGIAIFATLLLLGLLAIALSMVAFAFATLQLRAVEKHQLRLQEQLLKPAIATSEPAPNSTQP
ncbi:MAG TPA: hypothetical protein EYP10_06585 [Armatimonadetes bacterium]|nr:hypothetical protein [Armatimonadota bacterium]